MRAASGYLCSSSLAATLSRPFETRGRMDS